MAEDESALYIVLAVAVVAILGLALSVASFATHESIGGMMGGGGMMNGTGRTTTASGPGGFEWGILLASAGFLVLAVFLVLRARRAKGSEPRTALTPVPPPMPFPTSPRTPASVTTEPAQAATPAPSAPVAEPTLMKLLDEDERRMYLELRDHGGQMYQRDLVALGIFSKAKVTRVLDKLEAKGLVVREAHGMTNRVRLVPQPAR